MRRISHPAGIPCFGPRSLTGGEVEEDSGLTPRLLKHADLNEAVAVYLIPTGRMPVAHWMWPASATRRRLFPRAAAKAFA
jgi:hypothetical protein